MPADIDTAALRELAEKATPGPWWTDGRYDDTEGICSIIAARTDCGPLPGNPTRGLVALSTAILAEEVPQCKATAAFIAAANPATILSLLDQIDALKAQVDAARDDALAAEADADARARHASEADYDLAAAEARVAELQAECRASMATIAAERARAEAAEARVAGQIDYSIDLQWIIEDLCHDRSIRTPKTTARHHYDMAVAARSAAEAQVAERDAEIARLREAITASQAVLAEYIVPDSGISERAVVNDLLGILDHRDLVEMMRRAALSPPQQAGSETEEAWRSIETAPEDEHVILATTGGFVGEALMIRDEDTGTQKWAWAIGPVHPNHVPLGWQPMPAAPKRGVK